jgi:predicted ester cyclase
MAVAQATVAGGEYPSSTACGDARACAPVAAYLMLVGLKSTRTWEGLMREAALALLVAVAAAATPTEAADHRATVEALLKRYNEVVNTHRFDRLSKFYHDPLLYNGVKMSLADYTKAVMQPNVDAAPDIQWHIEGKVIDGDWLAVRYLDSGTLVKPYGDVKPTGRPFSNLEHAFYHLRDGKFDEVWDVYDYEAFRDTTAGLR